MSLAKDITKITGDLKTSLNKKNIYQVPRIKKVIVNVWIWTYLLKWWTTADDIVDNITAITWQMPVVIKSKLAVSNFKLRKWVSNWVKVTLRSKKMYDFLEKLITITFPRERDFRWISKKSFDKSWNYSFGIKDVSVFPEISMDDISKVHWLQITISMDSESKEDSLELLQKIWLPFEKK